MKKKIIQRKRASINQSNNGCARALLKLSRREGEVLALVIEGKTSRQIANKLYLSIRTVENHRYRIRKKLKLIGQGKGALKTLVKELF